jgi:NTP pyrophosphatase (non-canonical NTP hydrolase)
MDVDTYQVEAAETIQCKDDVDKARQVSLLGLSGEIGELSTEYKKKLRDGDSYKLFNEKITEELGDIFWYLSSLASLENISLGEVLASSLKKTKDRWKDLHPEGQLPFKKGLLDDYCESNEQFPREFVAEFKEELGGDGKSVVSVKVNGIEFGDKVRDNAYSDDYYRFHDIFHLSYVAVLGWSPVCRKLLNCKRRSDSNRDEVEDGGRGAVIDEAISILVFEYASQHSFFEGAGGVDYQLLRTIKSLTKNLEVNVCTTKQWEEAILLGYDMWRSLRESKSGRIICNMYERTMQFEKLF